MSGPRRSKSARMRAARTVNGPSNGYPATMASAPDSAASGAKRSAGRPRSSTCSTATSVRGSYSTTVAALASPSTSTVVLFDPATTCALVSTRSGAMTKPLPSSCLLQDSASALTFTIDGSALVTTGDFANAASGGGTSVIGVDESGSRICGNPDWSNRSPSLPDTSRNWSGITSSTVDSTDELRTAELSQA